MKKFQIIALLLGGSMLLQSCIKEYKNPAAGVVNDHTDLFYVRSAFQGNPLTINEQHLAGASFTSGTVISDKTAGNIDANTFVVQGLTGSTSQAGDITAGIVIEMDAAANVPALGDSVRINLVGATLQRKAGRLVVSGINAGKIQTIATNRTVEAIPVTLGMLNADFDKYESTLIAVHADVLNQGAATLLGGELELDDHTATMRLLTKTSATFAGNNAPVNAQFRGIATYQNDQGNDASNAKKLIMLRNAGDINFVSGPLYQNFPETFESPDASAKSSYNITATANNIDLATGNWKLQQGILGNIIGSDKMIPTGKQSVRLQQNLTTSALVQMNFDVTQGASKVTVFYGRYGTDPFSTFRLEYSINGGTSWVTVTPNISNLPDRGMRQATFMLNLTGNVRFRINKLGLGASSSTVQNGRLNIDDIAIYRK